MSEIIKITVDKNSEGKRLDAYLSEQIDTHSRSQIAKLLSNGNIKPACKPSFKVSEGMEFEIIIPDPAITDIVPEDIKLDILYEDSDVIIVNKPKGTVVHPDTTHLNGTIVNALMYHCKDLSGIGGELRPGIVHRIDMDTTGSVIACKNDAAHESIAAQLKAHSITRKYIAIAVGELKADELTIDAPVGRSEKDRKKMAVNHKNGKRAVTHVRVLERLNGFTLVECQLETGRTHQIRVHMASIHHPLLGDAVYGIDSVNKKYKALNGQCLHAKILGFEHPVSKEYIETMAPVPEYFENMLEKLRK